MHQRQFDPNCRRNLWHQKTLTPNNFFAKGPEGFTPEPVSTRRLLHHQLLRQTTFTPKSSTPDIAYTRNLLVLHQKLFHTRSCYTRNHSQQATFTPEGLYTRNLIHQGTLTPNPLKTNSAFHQRALTPEGSYTLGFSTEALHIKELLHQNTLGGVQHMFLKPPVLMAK